MLAGDMPVYRQRWRLSQEHMLLTISIASRQAGSRQSAPWASEAQPLSAMAPLWARSRSWTTTEPGARWPARADLTLARAVEAGPGGQQPPSGAWA